MNELEKQLFEQQLGGAEARLCIRSRARIDAGRWWRSTRVWLCVVGEELVMLAVARRRYFARVALADCGESHYHPLTGEFVIEPAGDLRFSRFPVSPREALQLAESMNLQPAGQIS